MSLTIDAVVLGVPNTQTAYDFYTSAFRIDEDKTVFGRSVELHGAGHLVFDAFDHLADSVGVPAQSSGFRGFVLSIIVQHPYEVLELLESAVEHGATVISEPKKRFFWRICDCFSRS
ncbi:hypothetical protein [Timonella sp. A28]|uniref:hypothetical protein n=1 Tax=Timonella sp. A28 TaxID=3442640 RepID=UPI003EC08053